MEKKKSYVSHLLNPYNLIVNNEFLYRYFGRKIVNSTLINLLVERVSRLRNVYWGSPANLFRNIDIETTTICNRKCLHCPVSKYPRKKAFMKEKLFNKIINELVEIKYRGNIGLQFYGEPLIDKRLPKFISYTRKKLPKAKISIYSNGDFLTPELFLELINAGVSMVVINKYDKEWSKNAKDTLKFVGKNKEYKKYLFCITKLYLNNRGGLVDIKEGGEREGERERERCFAPSNSISIIYNGDIVLCCNDYFGKIKFGNVNNEKLIDIWNSQNFKKIRKDCAGGVYKLEICKRCVGIIK